MESIEAYTDTLPGDDLWGPKTDSIFRWSSDPGLYITAINWEWARG